MRIMVLGAGGNAGINFCKSLDMDMQGLYILGVDVSAYGIARCNTDDAMLLDPQLDNDTKVAVINRAIKEFDIDLVHAQPDQEVKFLIQNKDNINAKIFDHSMAEWTIFANKMLCQRLWANNLSLGFKCYFLRDVLDNPDLFSELQQHCPTVWFRAWRGAGSKAALPMTSLEHAENWAKYWVDCKGFSMDDFMLCEFLPGKEYAVQTFWLNGKLIHSQARERVEYMFGNIMPSGQSSSPSVARTVSDHKVYRVAHRAVRSISVNVPHGIYCVDLKTNGVGEIIPTEVNYGRFFTTSDFFAHLGVNTPLEYCLSALDSNYSPEQKVNSLEGEQYWIRSIDREPRLVRSEELCHRL
jgi:carbamoyl-phosphate synthase large subunit